MPSVDFEDALGGRFSTLRTSFGSCQPSCASQIEA